MKKLLFLLVLFLGIGTGGIQASTITVASTLETIVMTKDFNPIDVKQLPDSVQKAIAAKYSELTIKAAFYDTKDDGTKYYKVVFADKEGKEIIVYYNEKGEEL